MGSFFFSLWSLLERFVIDPFMFLWPIKWSVVQPGWRAVRFTFLPGHGGASIPLGPGLVLYTSCQSITKRHVRRTTANTSQIVTITKDGVAVLVDAILVYEISDLRKALVCADSVDNILDAVANDYIRDTVQTHTFDGFRADTRKVQGSLVEDITDDMLEYGIVIHSCRFQELVVQENDVIRSLASKAVAPTLAGAFVTLRDAGVPSLEAAALLSGRLVLTGSEPDESDE